MFALNRFSISIYIYWWCNFPSTIDGKYICTSQLLFEPHRGLKGIHKRSRNVIPHASSFCLVNGKLQVALIYYNNCRTLDICCRFFVANFVWRNVKSVLVMLYVGKYNRAITQTEWRTNCYSRKIFEGTCICLITSILFPMWLIHLFIPTTYPCVMSQKVKIEKTMWHEFHI